MPVRVRKDIWELGDEEEPFRDPAILAYANAIRAMQKVDQTDPENGTSWKNQAAIHKHRGTNTVPGRLEDQCQHASWYFLPWHRMYLFQFEAILLSHMSAADAETWALPYWDYTGDMSLPDEERKFRRRLPPAFRSEELPDGTPNPLFIEQRQIAPLNLNGGDVLPRSTVRTDQALAPQDFTLPVTAALLYFGGPQTDFHHGTDGVPSPLEITPHGVVHTAVGGSRPNPVPGERPIPGFMGSFGTAGLDPLFWMHHANLDRLWEVWLRDRGELEEPGTNPTDDDWLDEPFELIIPSGERDMMHVKEVLDTEGQLKYTYSNLPPRPPAPGRDVAGRRSVRDQGPAEMVGATEEPVTLGTATNSARIAVSPPKGPAKRSVEPAGSEASGVSLVVEDIEGDANPGLVYGVYVNLPEGEAPDEDSPHFAGPISFFGIEETGTDDDATEEAPHQLRFALDITALVGRLKEQGSWDADELRVTFSPVEGTDEELADLDVAPVKVGRVSLFMG